MLFIVSTAVSKLYFNVGQTSKETYTIMHPHVTCIQTMHGVLHIRGRASNDDPDLSPWSLDAAARIQLVSLAALTCRQRRVENEMRVGPYSKPSCCSHASMVHDCL
jgi:hypothetical protein